VKGPKATQSFTATDDVTIAVDGNVVSITPRGKSKRARQQWGMSRTMVANMVTGVTAWLQERAGNHGVGYRAAINGSTSETVAGLQPRGELRSAPRCDGNLPQADRNRYRR
jgi:large subunit ribosomal protein L6